MRVLATPVAPSARTNASVSVFVSNTTGGPSRTLLNSAPTTDAVKESSAASDSAAGASESIAIANSDATAAAAVKPPGMRLRAARVPEPNTAVPEPVWVRHDKDYYPMSNMCVFVFSRVIIRVYFSGFLL